MAYSWNTKPTQTATQSSYSWSDPDWKKEIESRVSFVKQNPPKTFKQKLISSVNEGYDSAEVVPKSFKTAFLTPAPAEAAWKSWSGTITDTSNRFNAVIDTFRNKESSKLEKGVVLGQAGLGIVNTIFAPITAGINMLTPIPGIGHVADKVNQVFGGIAGGSGELGVAGLQEVPGLTPEQRTKLEPLVRELSGLAGMVLAGRASGKTYADIKVKTNTLLTEFKNKTAPTRPTTSQIPTETAVVEQTPKYSWNKKNTESSQTSGLGEENLFRSQTNLKLQEDARRVGIDIADESIPLRERMSMVENFKSAQEIVRNDPAKAERMLFERSVSPEVEVGSLYRALKEKALADGDPALIERLAKTPVGTESARALKSFDEGTALNADPVEALQYIRENRLKAAVGRDKTLKVDKEVMKTKKEVGNILPPDKMTWSDFIKSIEC